MSLITPCDHCSDTQTSGRRSHVDSKRRLRFLCDRCYTRYWRRKTQGKDPEGGKVYHGCKTARKNNEEVPICALCCTPDGYKHPTAQVPSRSNLATIEGPDALVCHSCYSWANRNRHIVRTKCIPAIRERRAASARDHYRNKRPSPQKTFWYGDYDPQKLIPKKTKRRKCNIPDAARAKIALRYRNGVEQKRLAEEYGVSRFMIHKICAENSHVR